MSELSKRQVIGYGMIGMAIVVAIVAFVLLQIIMWNRAANGQAAFEFINRQLAGQSVPSAAQPTPTAPPAAKSAEPKKEK